MPTAVTLTQPRRWTLALGVPVALAVIAYVALNYVALAGQDSFRLRPMFAPAAAQVTVRIGTGDVTLLPGSAQRAEVSGVVDYSLVRPTLRWQPTAGGPVLSMPDCYWADCDSPTLDVALPSGAAAIASSGSGDVTARNLNGPLTLSSASGDVTASRVSGELVLSDSSGDITVTQLASAQVRGSDASGDIDLSFSRPPSLVSISDASGDITVRLPPGVSYLVSANASSGSTEIAVPTNPSSRHIIDLNDSSGDITVVSTKP
jgi:hypothetical protein